jgi:hypothetical protein
MLDLRLEIRKNYPKNLQLHYLGDERLKANCPRNSDWLQKKNNTDLRRWGFLD